MQTPLNEHFPNLSDASNNLWELCLTDVIIFLHISRTETTDTAHSLPLLQVFNNYNSSKVKLKAEWIRRLQAH